MMYVNVCTFTEERNVQVMTQVDVRQKHRVLALTFHFEGLFVCLCRSQANRPMNFLGRDSLVCLFLPFCLESTGITEV